MFKLSKKIYPIQLIMEANEAYDNVFEVGESGNYYLISPVEENLDSKVFFEFANYLASLL